MTAVAGAVLSACAEEPPPPRVVPGPARDRILTPTPTPELESLPGVNSAYVVQPGDSVGLIAARFDASIEAIVAANNIDDPSRLVVGQELLIPGALVVAGAPAGQRASSLTVDAARPPVLPHAKAPPPPAPDQLEVLAQAVVQSPALPYAMVVGGVFAAGVVVRLLAIALHEARLALAGMPLLAEATVGGTRQRLEGTRSASSRLGAAVAPGLRLVRRSAGLATKPIHPLVARSHAALDQRTRPLVEALRSRLPRRAMDDEADEAAPLGVRETLAHVRQQAGPWAHDLWVRALTFAAHRSRFAAAMPYVRRYAGNPGLAWGMSGRVAAPSRVATTPTQHEIEASLAAGDLAVHFRPVFRVGGGLAGAMAVLRWRHPLRGWTAADRIVEAPNPGEAGPRLLLRLLLSEACRFAPAWRRTDPTFRVTITLSRSQLTDPQLASLIADELARVQLAADALELEVAERVATADVEQTAAVFRRLRDIGVTLAIDDFSGLLSEEDLGTVAPDGVKVDFWGSARNPHARSAVADAVRTVRPFGLEVTAKRVETPDEVDLLRELDCSFTWGDAFATPVPADRFAQAVSDTV